MREIVLTVLHSGVQNVRKGVQNNPAGAELLVKENPISGFYLSDTLDFYRRVNRL